MEYVTLTILVAALAGSTAFVAKQGLPVDTNIFSVEEEVLATSEVAESSDSLFGSMERQYFEPKTLVMGDSVFGVESVGLEPNGQLGTPSDWHGVGWYFKSAKPGEKGTVIIDGHYDLPGGAPAAFFSLKKVEVNDTLVVTDKLNRSFVYKVTDTFYVDIQDPNRTEVFEDETERGLVLVTCGGVWNPALQTYDKRLVVKASLEQ